MPAPPPTVGRYLLHAELARGGMGVVYAATDPALDREVAVKVLADRLAGRPASVRRFLSEARVSARLQHPGIPPVHEVGTTADGRPFLAMKLIRGYTLADLLDARPDPTADRGLVLGVFEAVCQAVGYAHSRGVLHRDLKPANVMVGAFGEVQVMDWGLAKVLAPRREANAAEPTADPDATTDEPAVPDPDDDRTQAGTMLGTPAFMPPEQAGGEVDRIDRRADVFGLGAVLCVILTGRPPYVGDTSEAVRLQAVRGQLADALLRLADCGAEPELADLCRRCLSADPSGRPADAGAVAAEVAGFRAAAEERAFRHHMRRAKAAGRAAGERERHARELTESTAAVIVVGSIMLVTYLLHHFRGP